MTRRLLPGIYHYAPGDDACVLHRVNQFATTASDINWNNTQVTSCPTAGTSSCIQLRADAVGYAVTRLASRPRAEQRGVTNQFQVGLFPFIQYLYSYFRADLRSDRHGLRHDQQCGHATSRLCWTPAINSNLGSGGTHFENAFPSMNSHDFVGRHRFEFVQSAALCLSCHRRLENYQTHRAAPGVTRKQARHRLFTITIAVHHAEEPRHNDRRSLYSLSDRSKNPTNFRRQRRHLCQQQHSAEYPAPRFRACASPNFFYTATTPADINNALMTMFEQAVSTAHITN